MPPLAIIEISLKRLYYKEDLRLTNQILRLVQPRLSRATENIAVFSVAFFFCFHCSPPFPSKKEYLQHLYFLVTNNYLLYHEQNLLVLHVY